MQCYPIPVPSLNTAQQYAETAGSLAEALHNLFLRRPCIRSDPSDPGAQAAYYRAVGAWYMENYDLIAAALMACHLLTDGAALELENVREAAESPAETSGSPADGLNAAGDISSLPESQNRENNARFAVSADMGENPQAPGGVLFYRQGLAERQNQQPKPARKQKGRAATSAGE